MKLVELRNSYVTRLQSLMDEKSKEIESKVNVYRAKLEAEQVAPFRAELEQQKVTPEMTQLVEFIKQLDVMADYENSHSIEKVEEPEKIQEDVVEDEPKEQEMFCSEDEEKTETINTATQSGFDAIAADVAQTRATIESAMESRPGMPTIVLPRR